MKNSRKTILWYYTGFRKRGRVFPIPLATILKSACMTLENKQDNVMSVELLFAGSSYHHSQTGARLVRQLSLPVI